MMRLVCKYCFQPPGPVAHAGVENAGGLWRDVASHLSSELETINTFSEKQLRLNRSAGRVDDRGERSRFRECGGEGAIVVDAGRSGIVAALDRAGVAIAPAAGVRDSAVVVPVATPWQPAVYRRDASFRDIRTVSRLVHHGETVNAVLIGES
jgi:hypothetical protein